MDTQQKKYLRKVSAELHYKFSKLFENYALTAAEFRYLRLEIASRIIAEETTWQKEEVSKE